MVMLRFWLAVGLALVAVLSGSVVTVEAQVVSAGSAFSSNESSPAESTLLPIGGENIGGGTAGFNVWHEGVPYLVTAGHAFEKGEDIYYLKQGPIAKVIEVWTPEETGRDIAIIEYLPGLKPKPISAVLKSREIDSPAGSILLEKQFEISGYADAYVGMNVCRTGKVTGTLCGEVTGFSSDVMTGGIETNICAEKGDSGAPLFTSEGKIVGILQGSRNGTGSCLEHVETKSEPLE